MKRRVAAYLAQSIFAFLFLAGFAHGASIGAQAREIKELLRRPFGPMQGYTMVRMPDGTRSKRFVSVAFDVGGKSAKTGFVTSEGEVIAKQSIPTGPDQTPDEFVELAGGVFGIYTQHLPNARRRHVPICIAVPGPLKDGILTAAPNLNKKWINFPIAERLAKSIAKELGTGFEDGMSITVANDAKAAGVGAAEHFFKGKPGTVVVATLGTGIGGAVIVNGNLVLGAGMAGEIGHLPVVPRGDSRVCGCGGKDHVEAHCGTKGIVATALGLLSKAKPEDWAILRELGVSSQPSEKDVTVPILRKAARQGDIIAKATWDDVGTMLAEGLAHIVKTLHPDAIVLIGNVARGGDLLRRPILRRFGLEPFKKMFLRYRDPDNFFIDGVTQYGVIGAGLLAWHAVTPH